MVLKRGCWGGGCIGGMLGGGGVVLGWG